MFILNLIVFIFVLGIIILIHELGHFIFAKRANILCHEFSIGMGPALYQKVKGETTYSVRAIPIGGYVSMAGESADDALIKVGNLIGLRLNDQKEVTHIILSKDVAKDVEGVVLSYDLYGKDLSPLYIEFQGQEESYSVLRDAKYVFDDQKEIQVSPSERSFETKTIWQRFLTIVAGPMMNFVLAFFLYLIVAMVSGKPQNINVIGKVGAGYDQYFNPKDQILEINEVTINNWNDINVQLNQVESNQVRFLILRDGQEITQELKLNIALQTLGLFVNTNENDQIIVQQAFGRASKLGLEQGDVITTLKIGDKVIENITIEQILAEAKALNSKEKIQVTYVRAGKTLQTDSYQGLNANDIISLGQAPIMTSLNIAASRKFDFGYMFYNPILSIKNDVQEMFATLGLLFNPKASVGIKDLSGPVGIFSLVSSITSQGIIALISFTAFLSINIGVLNLLPIPALDGGRIVFLGIEAVTRKKINRKVEYTIINVVFILLMILFLFVTFNDILRLF